MSKQIISPFEEIQLSSEEIIEMNEQKRVFTRIEKEDRREKKKQEKQIEQIKDTINILKIEMNSSEITLKMKQELKQKEKELKKLMSSYTRRYGCLSHFKTIF